MEGGDGVPVLSDTQWVHVLEAQLLAERERRASAEKRLSVAGTRLMALTVKRQRGTHVQEELQAIMVLMREGGR